MAAPKMSKTTAEEILGLTGTYNYKIYQKAFREKTLENHPDRGGDPKVMAKINEAKKTIAWYFGNDRAQVFVAGVGDVSNGPSGGYGTTTNSYADPYAQDHKDQSYGYNRQNGTRQKSWSESVRDRRAREKTEEVNNKFRDWKIEADKAREAAVNKYTNTVRVGGKDINAKDHQEWIENVGVPFEYAKTDNRKQWKQYNNEANAISKAHVPIWCSIPLMLSNIVPYILIVFVLWFMISGVAPVFAGGGLFDSQATEELTSSGDNGAVFMVMLAAWIPAIVIWFKRHSISTAIDDRLNKIAEGYSFRSLNGDIPDSDFVEASRYMEDDLHGEIHRHAYEEAYVNGTGFRYRTDDLTSLFKNAYDQGIDTISTDLIQEYNL